MQWDVIALPGGMPGAEHLRDNEMLTKLLKDPFDMQNALKFIIFIENMPFWHVFSSISLLFSGSSSVFFWPR